MAASRRKQDDKNLEVLRELISLNGNKYCLDCNQRGPTYVNTTIGSFVCSKCSGMLRGLTPPHRVKSISMATFTPEEIEFIKARGNDYCRRVWLGLYDGESVNFTDEQSVKDFMSDKYEKKRFYLESSLSNTPVTNGNTSVKNKKVKSIGGASITTPLISISPQTSKNGNNNSVSTTKVINTPVSETSQKLARPVNNFSHSLLTNITAPVSTPPISAPISDFPVDFSTANIYNSAQYNNNLNNNCTSYPSSTLTNFNAYNPSTTASTNDRYAALADLDLALRQQNMKNMEESNNMNSKNPFQSSTTNDLFSNKNPFFNGGWNSTTTPIPVNPFIPSTNSSLGTSRNPFL
ncbi:unnamed protein product [Parnassius mnemosyne]|uniref:Arf-GAP domain-containing protein n=1 Tax=Parnassius mnemosyne TaxID=213953 RepID=A0AAV1M8Y5_9NEOP